MSLRSILIAIFIGGLTVVLNVQADPWKNESGNNDRYHKQKHHARHENVHEVKYDADDDYRGPPPWAPAHGYRRKNKHDIPSRVIVQVPVREEHQYAKYHASPEIEFVMTSQWIGITSGTCNREAVGAVMGGIAGGVIGNTTASGDNKELGTFAGAIIGVVLGKELVGRMDKADIQCTSQVLERARDDQTVVWNNPDTGRHYSVIPYQSYKQTDGRYCRNYKATIRVGTTESIYKETACRNESGVWERKSR